MFCYIVYTVVLVSPHHMMQAETWSDSETEPDGFEQKDESRQIKELVHKRGATEVAPQQPQAPPASSTTYERTRSKSMERV